MTTVIERAREAYLALLDHPAGGAETLATRRREALERFEVAGFPSTSTEEWRQINLGPLLRSLPVRASHQRLRSARPPAGIYPGCDFLVFVNGRYQASVSSPPDGIEALSLADLAGRGNLPDEVAEHLAADASGRASCSADAGVHPFAALNTALFEDGAAILVPDGLVAERPIQVLWLTTPEPAAGSGSSGALEVSFPRLLVVAGRNSQATVIETFSGDGGYFVCPTAEFVCGAGSVLRHAKLQADGQKAFHLGFQHSRLERSACFDSCSLAFGGALVRTDTVALLDGEGADCILDGLYVVTGSRFVDNHMRVEHQKPHTTSHQLYKGVLDDRGRSVFNGRIYVHRAAQKTDAKQTNRNLLLSKTALANSNPQLEIFADDVRCTHGSTIGRLDEDALFYLRARGLPREQAHGMLVWAFARELIDKARFEPLRRDLEGRLGESLNGRRGD